MSKLESAFSKALREQALTQSRQTGDASSGSEPNSDSALARSIVADKAGNTEARKIKDIVSAKTQISYMRDDSVLTDEELANKKLVCPRMKDKNLLTIYRNLRTKLLAASGSKNFTTLVTSVVSGGGSSLISANIAATFAFDEGKTSLLVEGNVHNPSMARLFDLDKNAKGLTECLEGDELSVSDILYETGIPRLRFIPSGQMRENSSEYFTSEKMKQLIAEISARYPERYPIIDAPSICESADARILLDLCDRVVLIVPYGLCTKDDVENAVNVIGKEKLAGVVLNQF